ncbi:MAG TPA: recombination mediator RecR [Candidatus Polarisedimenticolia bacterium]|jgi:recombination protein RecR|nr:recombination mediator RecR [Candidatus Polarisedimenticolia bacterium]
MAFAAPLERLIERLRKLPGVGQKSAQRLAFHLMRGNEAEARALAEAILEVKEKIHLCSVCFNITDTDPCLVCTDAGRDRTALCVIEEPNNLATIEKTGQFRGLYHILHGALSPLKGIGPDDLKIPALLERLRDGTVKEVILATNPNVEGEATATYLSRLLKPIGVKVTRIALGLPVGSELEYADEVTVGKALEGRREL